MTVRLTSPVLGLAVGVPYTGNLESWLIAEGYATSAATVPDAWGEDSDGILGAFAPTVTLTPTPAVLAGSAAANATVGADGSIVLAVDHESYTVALLAADTRAGAATKIDTALTGVANAALNGGNVLEVTSVKTGPGAFVSVLGGTAAVLTALKLAVGDVAYGDDGRGVGQSNTGAQADVPANDPTSAANREAPKWPDTPELEWTIANDGDHLNETGTPGPINFDVDIAGVDTEAPSVTLIEPNTSAPAGGEVVRIYGDNLELVTGVTFGGTAGTALDVTTASESGFIEVTTPAKAAGTYNVVVTDNIGSDIEVGAFTYA